MKSRPADFERILSNLHALRRYPSEPLLIDHIQSSFESLTRIHNARESRYRTIVQQLLHYVELVISDRSQWLTRRIEFLRTLVSPSLSLAELNTLIKGVEDLKHSLFHANLDFTDRIIGDHDPALDNSTLIGQASKPAEINRSHPEYASNALDPATPAPEGRSAKMAEIYRSLTASLKEIDDANHSSGQLIETIVRTLSRTDNDSLADATRTGLLRQVYSVSKEHQRQTEQIDVLRRYLQLLETNNRETDLEFTRVRQLSLTDELTGLSNRRAFLNRLEDEIERVQRYYTPLALAMLDLDGFKEINDRYGHAAGDEVLRIYAKKILSAFRRHDQIARFGGEEFVILLPNTELDGAVWALKKAQAQVHRTTFSIDGTAVALPTFSAGITHYMPNESAASFVRRADSAMYRAKEMGKNRIETECVEKGHQESRGHSQH
jgi:diguanylate cyclase (GGDEF)-like protein